VPPTPNQQTANPFSTGGGGTVFELKVQAGLLATLLVRGHIPLFQNATLCELHLQAEHLDYETDDAVLVAKDNAGVQRRQLWSVKRDVKFTDSDNVFRDVIADAWADFVEPKRFTNGLDALVLATGPLASTHKHLLTLLEFARAAASSKDFYVRIGRKGFISEKARAYAVLIEKRCDESAGRKISADEVWMFLRCFHVLGYDFDQSASQDEARFKNLLALAIQNDSGKTGDDLWNAIFKWVADGNPRAKSFTRETLPAEWQQMSKGIGAHFESGAIQRLLEHSGDLLKRIRASIGSTFHLKRQRLSENLSAVFVNEPFTLVAGQAGVGKSAASLVALREVLCEAPLFVFQAAEFARDNLDHALADLRVTEPLSQISALFALHRRKFVLIESVERLLEATQRDAFFAFLSRLTEDPTWRVVLTCRQHAASMVQDAFLTPLNINAPELVVPLLSKAELDEVVKHFPRLQAVAANPQTNELLRNPYYLDKACSVDWSKESTTEPIDQRRLREILWRQVVIRDDVRAGGIHLQRDRCFQEIALRRARSLQSFVPVASGDESAVQALVRDELLILEPATNAVAPAHDVLEDWALVRWVATTFANNNKDTKLFFETLGHELPIRRCYRHWLRETLTAGQFAELRAFIDDILASSSIDSYWKDETIVSLLMSVEAPRFIVEHEAALLNSDKHELKIVIHLLRVACKKLNPIWQMPEGVLGKVFGDLHLVPDGLAWGSIIRLVYRNLTKFEPKDLPLLLGLLEDWRASVHWQSPLPDAAREVGLIALHFWNTIDDEYDSKEILERLASILLAVTQAIPTEFEELLAAKVKPDSRDYYHRNEIIEKKLLASLECWAACRSHPQAVADFAVKRWGIETAATGSSHDMSYASDMDGHFGLRIGLRHEYFPASALQGPFFSLLQWNPEIGIELILKLNNVATERFAGDGLDKQFGETPIEIEIDVGEGVTCKQWANPRLWMIYREGMPAPDILASALMALERWLLNLAESGQDLRDITRSLILKSNSVAVTAVVASVAMAYKESVGDTVLALFRTPEFFELDLQRYVRDQSSTAETLGDWGLNSAQKKIHHKDRLDSDKLPHRKQNLESLACDVQTTSMRDECWKIIDEFKSQLPPPSEQDDALKLWRLRFHRIDLRNFSTKEKTSDGRILFTAAPPDPDIAEVIQKSAPALKANEEAANVLVWGLSVFDQRDSDKFDPNRWREMLEKAQQLARENENKDSLEIFSYGGGPGYVAAVCVRDHWSELTEYEKQWCREYLLSKVMANKDTENEMLRIQQSQMSSAVAAAKVLPLLLTDADEPTQQKVREAIAVALTHSVDDLRQYAAMAVGWYLWKRDANAASACIAGLLDFASLERRSYGKWQRLPWNSRGSLQAFIWKDIPKVRARIASAEPLKQWRYYRFSVTESFSARVMPMIANIIAAQHSLPLAQTLQRQIAESLVHSWKREFQHSSQRRRDEQRNYEAESALKRQFAQFVIDCNPNVALELWKPFENAISGYADEVEEVFKQLIYAEDTAQKDASFWAIWQTTKVRLTSSPKFHDRVTQKRSGFAELSSVLLLDHIYWKEDAKEWKPLRGHENQIRDFFKLAGTAPPICQSFVRLLDGVGTFLLPEAVLWLAEQIGKGDSSRMIGDRNSLFSLARILTPLVFSQTETLRRTPALREATLQILDAMVNQGSSAAFRMRDFLITPTTPHAHTSGNESNS
jgi:hypothetical protein